VLAPDPVGVGGFKIDEVDGYDASLWPDMATFPSGHHAEVLRQTYGLLVQHMIHDLYRERDQRTMGQIRGTNAGASPYPFVIYNDNYDFGEYITAVVNSGFVGVLWSPEVRGSNDPMDMLRRVQAVCFSPLALYNGWASEQKLWTHTEVADHIRDAIKLRLRLIPYFYDSFAQYRFHGTPVIRPMPLAVDMVKIEAKDTSATGALDATHNPYEVPAAVREVKDQFFFGDALLVAPIAPADKTRKVVLPAGKWYDFYTGKFAGENTTIEVTPPLSQIPVFVKDGALIPMLAEDRPHAPAKGESLALEVRHYGTAPGEMKLYDDDGETFAFERGEYSWTNLSVTRGPDGKWQGNVTSDANGRRWSYSTVSWKFMSQP
jgi:alpha-D-xyloside xylohydrolase